MNMHKFSYNDIVQLHMHIYRCTEQFDMHSCDKFNKKRFRKCYYHFNQLILYF